MNLYESFKTINRNDWNDVNEYVKNWHELVHNTLANMLNVETGLVDQHILKEIKSLITEQYINIYFGKTLCDLKCTVTDESSRDHDIIIQYKAQEKIKIVSTLLPYSDYMDIEYKRLQDIIDAVKNHLESLECYFLELENIDRYCNVMEPTNPSFRDNFRKIQLNDRIWLHVEVAADGTASNIHIVGYLDSGKEQLQEKLLAWDHDKDIVENIVTIFDQIEFPEQLSIQREVTSEVEKKNEDSPTFCSICLCCELPGIVGIPQPLCQNSTCNVFFHRCCLFQWLVSCSGVCVPAFGIANGICPCCEQPITCMEKDD